MENLPEGTTPHTTNIPNASAGRTRVFSGAQPSADSLHLGNYIGAVGNWVKNAGRPEERMPVLHPRYARDYGSAGPSGAA